MGLLDNVPSIVDSRNLISSYLGIRSADGLTVWTGEPLVIVIHVTPESHRVECTKMRDAIEAYEVILPQPAPAAGISTINGGQMEIVTADMRREEAKLNSGHPLLIGLSMCAKFEGKKSLFSNFLG